VVRARWRPALTRIVVGSMMAVMVGTEALPVAAQPSAPARSAGLPWLRVAAVGGSPATGPGRQIVDDRGRTVVLRGVNVAGIEDDYYTVGGRPPTTAPAYPVDPAAFDGICPADRPGTGEPPVCQDDLAQVRSLGFDVIRLTVSWSLLEPTPGRYDPTYLDRIAQVVGWARSQGVYVLIDMHQDAYSRYTPTSAPASVPPVLEPSGQGSDHSDGAPAWAVIGDGVPAEGVGGQLELNSFVAAAFTNFWLNTVPTDGAGHALPQGQAPGPGLQDHYIGAMAAIASRFVHDPAVVGYEIMNEPLPGVIAPGAFDLGYLYPFYRRVIDALAGTHDGVPCPVGTSYGAACGYRDLAVHDRRHLFFFEPMAARNLTDVAVGLSAPFSSSPNLVYAPHVYTHVFTADQQVPGGVVSGVYPVNYDQAFETAGAEARLLHAALFVGEFGNGNGDDSTTLASETAAIDKAGVGSTLWQWKSNCGPAPSSTDCWSMYFGPGSSGAENGPVIPSRARYVSRVVPRATAGRLVAFAYDPLARHFTMQGTDAHAVQNGDLAGDTAIYIPPSVTAIAPVGWAPVVSGAAVLDRMVTASDGSCMVYVSPTGAGAYEVSLAL